MTGNSFYFTLAKKLARVGFAETELPNMPEQLTARAAVRGDNQPPDYAKDVTDRMAADYAALAESVSLQLEEARTLPSSVENEADLQRFSDLVVRLRDTGARAEGSRAAEKEPYLRGGQAVDGFFNALKDRLAKGAAVLGARVNDYQRRKLAEERLRRQREAEEAARAAREAQEKAEADARAAAEAERAAEIAKRNREVKREAALDAGAAADASVIEARLAQEEAELARVQAAQKPAEMTRQRLDEGRLVTMRQVPHVEVTDKMMLDAVRLWPFIKEEHALQALRAWAKTNAHKIPMRGAIIEMRDDTVIR